MDRRCSQIEFKDKSIRDICKFSLSLGLLSPPNPSFSGVLKSKEILLNVRFERKYSNCTVGAVKIYVAAAEEALRKKERQGETQEPSNLMFF